jgi:hypothetical protein
MTGGVATGPPIGAPGAADTLRVLIEMRAMSTIDERKRIKITVKKYCDSIWNLFQDFLKKNYCKITTGYPPLFHCV